MRAGPGLGNIGPEQGDYNQVVKGGGNGNYKNIVLAPDSVQEMCDMTIKAFELAFKYRNPVFVLADAVLGQMIEPLNFPETAIEPTIDTSWAVSGTKDTMKNLITSIVLDFDELEELNNKLQKKYAEVEANEVDFDTYKIDDADIILVAYGISARISRSTVDIARKEGKKVGLFRPKTLFPFPKNELKAFAKKGVRFISVEMSNGQMIDDVKLAIECKCPVELVSRMGGVMMTNEEIMKKINSI